ncbi:hypothetical protein BV898_19673 [Hypsibius exemplaris]|uniref:Uncharacterized protein n=1 Tax=Hypsibius exemplaris TaxID=2072580 RepID=A0A9X6NJE4_HYPEX|nr:hypothetical protein BV898_19673 [Hypsibius exemplaris]
MPMSLCLECQPIAYGAIGLNAMINEQEWETYMPAHMHGVNICRCARLVQPSTAPEDQFEITLRNPSDSQRCEAIITTENRSERMCERPAQSVGLYIVPSGDKPVFFCDNHYDRARRHEMCICGEFPNSYDQRDMVQCVHNHLYHRGCVPADAPCCPHNHFIADETVEEKPHASNAGSRGGGGSRIFTSTNMAMMFAVVCLMLTPTSALTLIACDCTAPQLVGSVNFGTQGCEAEKALTFQDVDYSVVEHDPADFTFGGFGCRAWDLGVRVESFWDAETDTTTFRHPVSLSAQDCWRFGQTKTCNEKPMTSEDGVSWGYEHSPVATRKWRPFRRMSSGIVFSNRSP